MKLCFPRAVVTGMMVACGKICFFIIGGTKNDLVKGSWDYLYKVIAQANQSLDKLKEILENNPENISVPKYISEVRAFRAMYYYYLLDMFARVPLVTSSSVAMEDVVQSERSAVF